MTAVQKRYYEWKTVLDMDVGPHVKKSRVAEGVFKAGELRAAVYLLAVYRQKYAGDMRAMPNIELHTWVEDAKGILSASVVHLHWSAGMPYINGVEVGALKEGKPAPSPDARREVELLKSSGPLIIEL